MAGRPRGRLITLLCLVALAGCSSSGGDGHAAPEGSTTSTSTSVPAGQLQCSEPALVVAARRFVSAPVHVTGVGNFHCSHTYAVGLTACGDPTKPTEQCQVALMLFRGTSGSWEVIKSGDWACADLTDVGDREGCFALGLPA